jgi:hypothetical protein
MTGPATGRSDMRRRGSLTAPITITDHLRANYRAEGPSIDQCHSADPVGALTVGARALSTGPRSEDRF